MQLLIFGSDSSTHALTWKLFNSTAVDELILAPGNSGTSFFATSTALDPHDLHAVVSFALSEAPDLVIADPHAIASGVVDELRTVSIAVCGSQQALAPLHASRCAAREWLHAQRLPVPRSRVCTTPAQAEAYAATLAQPLLIVPDAPAAPARIADRATLGQVIAECFADGPDGVIVEELVNGPVVTAALLTDGTTSMSLPPTRIYTAANAPYAAGDGVQSAATALWRKLDDHLDQQIRHPLRAALHAAGSIARGWISVRCVLGPRGPLAQTIQLVPTGLELAATLPRLDDDLLPLLVGAARGTLADVPPPCWRADAVVGVGVGHTPTTAFTSEGMQRAIEAFEPGTITFQHAPGAAIHNPYVPRAARSGKTRSSLFGFMPAPSTPAPPTDDPLLAIVVAAASDRATARERVYRNLHRSPIPASLYRHDAGASEV